jgi:hypothetical protein
VRIIAIIGACAHRLLTSQFGSNPIYVSHPPEASTHFLVYIYHTRLLKVSYGPKKKSRIWRGRPATSAGMIPALLTFMMMVQSPQAMQPQCHAGASRCEAARNVPPDVHREIDGITAQAFADPLGPNVLSAFALASCVTAQPA